MFTCGPFTSRSEGGGNRDAHEALVGFPELARGGRQAKRRGGRTREVATACVPHALRQCELHRVEVATTERGGTRALCHLRGRARVSTDVYAYPQAACGGELCSEHAAGRARLACLH